MRIGEAMSRQLRRTQFGSAGHEPTPPSSLAARFLLRWISRIMTKPMPRAEPELIADPHHSPQEILSHPSFPLARRAFVDSILGLYENDVFLNRLLIEAGRHVVFMMLICMHARYREEDRPTWPTIGRLKEAMRQFDLSSSRRIEDLVGRLVHNKFIQSTASPVDGRVRILTPSDEMLERDADWLAAHYQPLQILYPQPGYPLILQRDRPFQRAHRSIAWDFAGHGAQILASNPDMMLFMSRDVGMMVLMKLIQMAGAEPEGTSEGLSFAEIGERFGATRTHVRSVLQDAEKAGLVDLIGRAGKQVTLRPRVLQAFDRFIADSMSGHDLLYKLAAGEANGWVVVQTLEVEPSRSCGA
jgi:hypothetical protein